VLSLLLLLPFLLLQPFFPLLFLLSLLLAAVTVVAVVSALPPLSDSLGKSSYSRQGGWTGRAGVLIVMRYVGDRFARYSFHKELLKVIPRGDLNI
jgi:hypothetical protein